MNSIEHFKTTKKTDGLLIALLSVLPDVFVVARKIVPLQKFQKFCLDMHNTEESICEMYNINWRLGRAWEKHREQDLATHSYTYEKGDEMERIPKDSILLLSGGLDSFAIWRLLGKPPAVYFAIGHRAEAKEIAMIEKIKAKFGGDITIDRSLQLGRQEMENGYIPYRNLFFIMLASYYSKNVVLAQILEYAPDKNKEFYHKTEKLLKEITTGKFQGLNGNRIKVLTPFANYTKTELVAEYCKKYSPQDLIDYTISCYSGEQGNCGECSSCFSRYIAMVNNKIKEEYKVIPNAKKFRQKISVKDFKLNQLKMYIKRWLEMKKYL